MPTSPQCWHRRWMVPSGSSSATSMPRGSTLNRTSRYATMPLHFLHRAAQYNLSVITNPRLRLLTRGGQIHNYGSASLVLPDFENRGFPKDNRFLIRAALSLVTGEGSPLFTRHIQPRRLFSGRLYAKQQSSVRDRTVISPRLRSRR